MKNCKGLALRKLTKEEITLLLLKIPQGDRAEALEVIESDYTELLYDPNIHPVEIGRNKHLRFVPDSVKVRGERVEAMYTIEEYKKAENNDKESLKRMGYSLEKYFETPVVRAWCKTK